MTDRPSISVIIPARNECTTIGGLVASVRAILPEAEVLVVDDGSTDDTRTVAREAGARVVHHPIARGNGAAVKSGARQARGDIFVFMDGDGQHAPEDIPRLLAEIEGGYDLVVGARDASMHANRFRLAANWFYNALATWITGAKILDLTSGFRAARAGIFRSFLSLLPNGFSYPTTSTMAFLRDGYGVTFVPIAARQRPAHTRSHIRLLRDGGRFLIIIFRVGTLYSPLKIFVPFALLFFLTGVAYYGYTYATVGRFTNLGALLFTSSVFVFLIGLVSEQITQLQFSQRRPD